MWYRNSEKEWINLAMFSSFFVCDGANKKYDICGPLTNDQSASHIEHDFKNSLDAQKFLDLMIDSMANEVKYYTFDEINKIMKDPEYK
jgi:hypothetical protein